MQTFSVTNSLKNKKRAHRLDTYSEKYICHTLTSSTSDFLDRNKETSASVLVHYMIWMRSISPCLAIPTRGWHGFDNIPQSLPRDPPIHCPFTPSSVCNSILKSSYVGFLMNHLSLDHSTFIFKLKATLNMIYSSSVTNSNYLAQY